MKVLLSGDIVGAPGRFAFAQITTRLKAQGAVDFVIANAENAAGGKGLTPNVATELFAAGADVLTLGDHTWDQKELVSYINVEPRILRPANFAPGCPGRGIYTCDTPHGKISIVNLVGRVFMPPFDCPFRCADVLLANRESLGRTVIVDIHAEATSEKMALGRYLDGRVSAVVGTHTHVQTADEQILPNGTAYLTDLGMTGPKDSIIGRDVESILKKFLTGLPVPFKVADENSSFEGVLLDIDPQNGRARTIKRIREFVGAKK